MGRLRTYRASYNGPVTMEAQLEHAILRLQQVKDLTGLSKTTLWRRIRDGEFPAALRLGGPKSRAVGWRRSEVEQWLRDRQAS